MSSIKISPNIHYHAYLGKETTTVLFFFWNIASTLIFLHPALYPHPALTDEKGIYWF